jgi:hypothetical protein
MELLLKRVAFTGKSTIGELSIDGEFFCHTLEDVVRQGPKVYGKTAIPAGTYEVIIDFSKHFKKKMPHILNVPGFEGIRIHTGNKAEDTEGCILLGLTKGPDFIGRSRDAYAKFFNLLEAGLEEGKVFITITGNAIQESK